jgi:hypothetical protein
MRDDDRFKVTVEFAGPKGCCGGGGYHGAPSAPAPPAPAPAPTSTVFGMTTLEVTRSSPQLDPPPTDNMSHEGNNIWVNIDGDSLKLAGFGYPKKAIAYAYDKAIPEIPFKEGPAAPTPDHVFPVLANGTYCVQVQETCHDTLERDFVLIVWLKYDDGAGNTHYVFESIGVHVPICSAINPT